MKHRTQPAKRKTTVEQPKAQGKSDTEQKVSVPTQAPKEETSKRQKDVKATQPESPSMDSERKRGEDYYNHLYEFRP